MYSGFVTRPGSSPRTNVEVRTLFSSILLAFLVYAHICRRLGSGISVDQLLGNSIEAGSILARPQGLTTSNLCKNMDDKNDKKQIEPVEEVFRHQGPNKPKKSPTRPETVSNEVTTHQGPHYCGQGQGGWQKGLEHPPGPLRHPRPTVESSTTEGLTRSWPWGARHPGDSRRQGPGRNNAQAQCRNALEERQVTINFMTMGHL
ncbi:hypothetical protein Taro_015124 [Colocasia esculenta]|uniref:Uncharacterized protein n=1 Tax=Colocasia esculenta TaxID=4460 RepID=A0A843US93_COLES|nr:hypothetical protein [Colocasia esculenta]